MYATVLDYTLKSDDRDEALALVERLVDRLKDNVEGLRSFLNIDRGDNKGTAIAVYETKAAWEAAAPVAQEVLGEMAPFLTEAPVRTGCDVLHAKRYITD